MEHLDVVLVVDLEGGIGQTLMGGLVNRLDDDALQLVVGKPGVEHATRDNLDCLSLSADGIAGRSDDLLDHIESGGQRANLDHTMVIGGILAHQVAVHLGDIVLGARDRLPGLGVNGLDQQIILGSMGKAHIGGFIAAHHNRHLVGSGEQITLRGSQLFHHVDARLHVSHGCDTGCVSGYLSDFLSGLAIIDSKLDAHQAHGLTVSRIDGQDRLFGLGECSDGSLVVLNGDRLERSVSHIATRGVQLLNDVLAGGQRTNDSSTGQVSGDLFAHLSILAADLELSALQGLPFRANRFYDNGAVPVKYKVSNTSLDGRDRYRLSTGSQCIAIRYASTLNHIGTRNQVIEDHSSISAGILGLKNLGVGSVHQLVGSARNRHAGASDGTGDDDVGFAAVDKGKFLHLASHSPECFGHIRDHITSRSAGLFDYIVARIQIANHAAASGSSHNLTDLLPILMPDLKVAARQWVALLILSINGQAGLDSSRKAPVNGLVGLDENGHLGQIHGIVVRHTSDNGGIVTGRQRTKGHSALVIGSLRTGGDLVALRIEGNLHTRNRLARL